MQTEKALVLETYQSEDNPSVLFRPTEVGRFSQFEYNRLEIRIKIPSQIFEEVNNVSERQNDCTPHHGHRRHLC